MAGKQKPWTLALVLPPTHTHYMTSSFPLSRPQFPNMPNLY